MFQTYEEIFAERAASYHHAMTQCPDARAKEFNLAVTLAAPSVGDTVCDVPSGGGYLRRYMSDPEIGYLGVETSRFFAEHCYLKPNDHVILSALENVAVNRASIDICISLAGIHHLPDKPLFFREVTRLLKPGGRFLLADVETGTASDRFLNHFVHETNSMGHDGDFLSSKTRDELGDAGLVILDDDLKSYTWDFESEALMGQFCQNLFGIDRVDADAVVAGIEDILGYEKDKGAVRMNWGLSFIVATKPFE